MVVMFLDSFQYKILNPGFRKSGPNDAYDALSEQRGASPPS